MGRWPNRTKSNWAARLGPNRCLWRCRRRARPTYLCRISWVGFQSPARVDANIRDRERLEWSTSTSTMIAFPRPPCGHVAPGGMGHSHKVIRRRPRGEWLATTPEDEQAPSSLRGQE